MMQNCTTPFSNGTACNTPYVRLVTLCGIVKRYNVFGFEIDYCPQCGCELSQAEIDTEKKSLNDQTPVEQRAWFESIEPIPF